MRSAKFEIDRLRYTLISKGLTVEDADQVCDQASIDISAQITEAMAQTMSAVAEAAIAKDAHEFIMEMKMVPRGDMFVVGTESGNSDFTTPPFPMLDKLLRNGKVAKDGTIYKVIPIGKPGNRQKVTVNIGDVQTRIQAARESASKMTGVGGASSSMDPMSGPARFSEMATFRNAVKRGDSMSAATASKGTSQGEFRTATSKQDRNTQWVLPEKEKDMTQVVTTANDELISVVEDIIMSTVRQYEESL